MENIDKEVYKYNFVAGINYIRIDNNVDNYARLYEIYYKNNEEWKLIGVKENIQDLKEYQKNIYLELIDQGMNEPGSKFIALEMKNEKDSELMMKYLISIRKKQVSYTEIWKEKEKIVK